MESTSLNWILVTSFGFVSVALGIKWIGEIVIEYLMARQGYQVVRMSQEDVERMLQEGDDDDSIN